MKEEGKKHESKESKSFETKEHKGVNKDLVGKNVMQKDAKHRPKAMRGRDAGEHGKKWGDHFGE